jgi:predicted nuclease of predicted toxin-antitoxin system
MKLLFDQNLAGSLVQRVADLFPDSIHVNALGMAESDDKSIWSYAKDNGFTIISKDFDFHQRSVLFGSPPKVIWLRVGNCPVITIERLIRDNSVSIHTFEADAEQDFLILS